MSTSKRELIKGPLRPPRPNPLSLSSSEPPASKDDIQIRKKGNEVKVIEFSSSAVPQPFLDPSIIELRIQAEKQWKAEEAKKKEANAAGSNGG